eukprot:gene16864-20049_t
MITHRSPSSQEEVRFPSFSFIVCGYCRRPAQSLDPTHKISQSKDEELRLAKQQLTLMSVGYCRREREGDAKVIRLNEQKTAALQEVAKAKEESSKIQEEASKFKESAAKVSEEEEAEMVNIQNQGQCGSCWAFGASALVSCDDIGNQGCNGGVPQLAWEYMELHGLPTLDCFPYTSGANGTDGPCSKTCADGSDYKLYKAKPFTMKTCSSVAAIQQDIFTYGPIEGIMEVGTQHPSLYHNVMQQQRIKRKQQDRNSHAKTPPKQPQTNGDARRLPSWMSKPLA